MRKERGIEGKGCERKEEGGGDTCMPIKWHEFQCDS